MADNMIGNNDAAVQQIIINSQQANQQTSTEVNKDDGAREAERKAAEKRLTQKQQALNKEVGGRESFDRAGNKNALYEEAFSGRMGPDVQRWAKDDGLQQKLTGAQKRLFLESFEKDSPRGSTQKAAEAINRLATSDAFAAAVPTSLAMGEVHQTLLRDPGLEAPMERVLQSRFMQTPAPKADTTTKADFLRFGMQNMQKGNLQSVKAAGDMLGTLAGQVPANAQRAAMKMVQRDPMNFSGMENVDAFVQQPAVARMPEGARGKATEVLARADGTTDVRSGLESVTEDKTFSTLGGDDKARVFSTIGQGRTSDFRAITDKVLQTLRSPDFPARQSQVSRLLTRMGNQVTRGGPGSVAPRELIRSAKKTRISPPTLTSTANIDPEDEEALTKAQSDNRSKVMLYYSKVSSSYDKVEKKLDGAKYYEDVNGEMDGLRPTKSLELSGLDVADDVRQHADERMDSLKQGLRGSDRQAGRAQFDGGLKTFQRDLQATLGRALTTDEVTFVLATVTQADSEMRYSDLAKEKNKRTRDLRNTRMPPAQRQREQAARRVDGEQPRYFSPGANRAARGAFNAPVSARDGRSPGPVMGRMGPGRSDLAAPQGSAMPRAPAVGQLGQRTGVRTAEATGTAAPLAQGRAATLQGAQRVGSVEDEIANIMAGLDSDLSSAAKMAQAKNMMATQLKRHIQVVEGVMNALLAEPGEVNAPNLGQNETAAANAGESGHAASAGQPGAAAAMAGGPEANAGPRDGPKSLAPVEAIGERPRGAAAALARLVAEAGAQPAPTARGLSRAVVQQAPIEAATDRARTVQGKTDGWNIPRTFERDLGAQGAPVVRPAASRADRTSHAGEGDASAAAPAPYTGKTMVKSSTPVRDMATLQGLTWKQLTPPERALLQNLDWKQSTWDTQTQPRAQWPVSMKTPYSKLSEKQREAVRILKKDMSAEEWDDAIGLSSGGSGGTHR